MTTLTMILSVDELRVVTDIIGGTLPTLLDEYETAEPAADDAATRSLIARGLAAHTDRGLRLDATLTAALQPLTDVRRVVELERPGTRRAESTDAGQRVVGLTEVAPDVWALDDRAAIGESVTDLLEAAEPAADTDLHGPVALARHEHDLVADLLAAGRHDEIPATLAHRPQAARLAAALADPGTELGRLTRAERDADPTRDPDATVREHSCAWVRSDARAWTVFTSEPLHAEDDSVFMPADPTYLAEQIRAVLTGAAEPVGA